MVTDLVPASYDLLWTLTLLVVLVIVPAALALVGYGVVRLGVRHELARHDSRNAQRKVPVHD